jgi:dTDP-4-dehydrorhamnose 3,5-epimerase
MRFIRGGLRGVWTIEPVAARDDRGFFARTFCVQEFAAHGLEANFVQHSISHSRVRGTVRGLHFQRHPHTEIKLVSCQRGKIWDVVVDLRAGSPTYCRWESFMLSAENRRQLYIPRGFAHGFQSLSDDAEVAYMIANHYVPDAGGGVRYNDPAFGIDWPLPPTMLSDKDQSWPDFSPEVGVEAG